MDDRIKALMEKLTELVKDGQINKDDFWILIRSLMIVDVLDLPLGERKDDDYNQLATNLQVWS